MKAVTYNAVITEEDGQFVALNPEYDVASQGDTVEVALTNLQEALELYLEELKDSKLPRAPHQAFLTTFTL
ncbi:MAG: type II toxin-antitoxin system HicB family antitoxin [Candidatus Saccharibacteria bacterium]